MFFNDITRLAVGNNVESSNAGRDRLSKIYKELAAEAYTDAGELLVAARKVESTFGECQQYFKLMGECAETLEAASRLADLGTLRSKKSSFRRSAERVMVRHAKLLKRLRDL